MKGKMLIAAVAAIAGVFILSGIAMAHDWTARRQAKQLRRIQRGVELGEITPRERHRLMQEERRIRQARKRAWRDGCLDPWERRKLDQMLDRASDHIYWARHNRLRRRPLPPVCWPPRRPPRRPPVTYIWPDETHFFFSGFFSDPSWGFGWFITDP